MQLRNAVVVVLLTGCGIVAGQSTPKIKTVPIKETEASSGKQMYLEYCASCHGKDGKGDGPAAVALKAPPSNLATLTARNNGSFPALRVSQSIEGDGTNFAHGSREMPVWGQVFHTNETKSVAKLRVANLTDYVKSLQAK
jgi:mono/diheme cytochrome c family protein